MSFHTTFLNAKDEILIPLITYYYRITGTDFGRVNDISVTTCACPAGRLYYPCDD
jgi:hypothetical protein